MQRSRQRHLLLLLGPTLDDVNVIDYASPLIIIQAHCALIADPTMNSSTSRIDPQQMPETEIFSQNTIDYACGHGNEGPTATTDGFIGTTGSDGIVVCHVDIKHQFAQ